MAEVFGVAAGVVGVASLAIQLAQSVKKLKEFCDQVKNVPVEVEETIEEIELLSNVLTMLEATLPSGGAKQPELKKCVDLCQRGVQQISEFVKAFEDRLMGGRRRDAIKVVFRLDKMTIPIERLERGKATLLLAYQMYQAMIQHETLQKIVAGQTTVKQETQALAVAPLSNDEDAAQSLYRRQTASSSALKYTIYLRTPAWFSDRVWSLAVEQVNCGWTAHFRHYRVLPWDEILYCTFLDDDAEYVNILLQRREISPYDHTDWTAGSLLQVAMKFGAVTVARVLIEHGGLTGDLTGEPIPELTYALLDRMSSRAEYLPFSQVFEENVASLQFLANRGLFDMDAAASLRNSLFLHKPTGLWTDHDCFTFCSTVLGQCKEYIADILSVVHLSSVPPHWWRIAEGPVLLLHSVAKSLAMRPYDARCMEDCTALLTQSVQAAIDLHTVEDNDDGRSDHQGTALAHLISKSFHIWMPERDEVSMKRILVANQTMNKCLKHWVDGLEIAGVDLMLYGTKESKLVSSETIPRFRNVIMMLGVWSFAYGPDPSDWHCWFDHPGDRFAGQFWDMIEHPERSMPGAWIDRHDYWYYWPYDRNDGK